MISIVSGLPRSGTSLMMQMLAAGGLPALWDGERAADTDNPRGYLEWERIKQLPKDPHCIAEAEGKVVKVISQLLPCLPDGHDYCVIFMERPLPEVLKSQEQMLSRRGKSKPGAGGDSSLIAQAFRRHLMKVDQWLAARTKIAVLRVQYHRILREPQVVAEEVANFLRVPLDIAAMTQQVDPNLYRNRTSE